MVDEVVLPIHDPHEDNSTDTPEDEDTLFDREEALRHDEITSLYPRPPQTLKR